MLQRILKMVHFSKRVEIEDGQPEEEQGPSNRGRVRVELPTTTSRFPPKTPHIPRFYSVLSQIPPPSPRRRITFTRFPPIFNPRTEQNTAFTGTKSHPNQATQASSPDPRSPRQLERVDKGGARSLREGFQPWRARICCGGRRSSTSRCSIPPKVASFSPRN